MAVICHCEPTKVGVAISSFMSLRSGQSPLWQSRCCLVFKIFRVHFKICTNAQKMV